MLYLDRDTATKGTEQSIIKRYNNDNPIDAIASAYGYIQRTADEYQTPNSKSGHLVKLSANKDMLISLSDSDAGIGRQINGAWCADAFDLFKYYECGNDVKVAISKLKEVYPSQPAPETTQEAEHSNWEGFAITDGLSLASQKFKPIVWLKPDLLPIPNLALLAAAPKVGKSWFALKISRDLTEAGHEVMYIANEDNERRLKDRYAKVADFPSSKLRFLSGLSSERPIPKGDNALSFLKALKTRYPALRCIIIDTLQAIRDQSLKQDYGFVENEFSKLRKLAHELEITILAVHHTKKKTDYESSPLDNILGSQGIAATVETILVLEQVIGSQDVNLFVTGKDVEQREDYRLTWTDSGFSEPEGRAFAELGHIQKSIINYVKEHPSCTQAAIASALARTKQQVNEAVTILLERGHLKKVEGKKLICLLA